MVLNGRSETHVEEDSSASSWPFWCFCNAMTLQTSFIVSPEANNFANSKGTSVRKSDIDLCFFRLESQFHLQCAQPELLKCLSVKYRLSSLLIISEMRPRKCRKSPVLASSAMQLIWSLQCYEAQIWAFIAVNPFLWLNTWSHQPSLDFWTMLLYEVPDDQSGICKKTMK